MLLIFLILLVAVPILEFAVIIQVGSMIGLWPMTALLLLGSISGAFVLRSQGRGAWRRYKVEVRSGKPPSRAAFDRFAVFTAGLLLLIPGFITDLIGLFILFPPSRALIRRFMARWWRNRVILSGTAFRLRAWISPRDTIEHRDPPVVKDEKRQIGPGS